MSGSRGLRVGIIGCGLIGQKRAASFDKTPGSEDRLIVACDVNAEVASKFGAQHRCESTQDPMAVIKRSDVDAVVIAVFHGALAELTQAAIAAGKHVIVEKPAARNARELSPVVDTYLGVPASRRPVVKVGFNHRFHPAFLKAREIIDSGVAGELMFIRGRYGHGGRVGYEKEWRANAEISGGGELLDQGMHLIDLSRWFLGDFAKVMGCAKTFFWNMNVDDNAFMLLETKVGQVAQLHVTWTEWKNLFSFEIYGKMAKLHIEGLGGSYGVERLSHYQMSKDMGPPATTIYEYPGKDTSWEGEWQNFKRAVAGKEAAIGDIVDAFAGLKVVETMYRENNYDHLT